MKTKLFFIAVAVVAATICSLQKASAQWLFNGSHIYNSNSGNVGIGTNAPQQKLSVNGSLVVDQNDLNNGTASSVNPGITFGNGSGEGISSNRTQPGTVANGFGLDFYTGFNPKMSITWGGNVGIGTTTPSFLLDVAGKMNVKSSLYLNGKLTMLQPGNYNFFVGPGAGNTAVTVTGSNTGIGANALHSVSSGSLNTANGVGALQYTTTGSNNTATGYHALYTTITGHDNTANGMDALEHTTTGYQNTANGAYALHNNTTGNWNTAHGFGALQTNTTGKGNTAVGDSTLWTNSTGSYNTTIGYFADVTTGGLTNATAIGANAKVSQSNTLILGGTGSYAVKVGIGTTKPQYALSVNGTIQAKGIRVETGWADFVFDKNYKLRSLKEVQDYINAEKHLPDIPSAKEIQQNGLAVAEMQTKMMQKIEELTLYIIEQEKSINNLKEQNAKLETKINALVNKGGR